MVLSAGKGMADKYEYVNTPTECLNELKHIALQKGIDKSTLPKDGSRLTKAFILIRDELSEVYGLDFEQKRGKERLYVITNKNLKEEPDREYPEKKVSFMVMEIS